MSLAYGPVAFFKDTPLRFGKSNGRSREYLRSDSEIYWQPVQREELWTLISEEVDNESIRAAFEDSLVHEDFQMSANPAQIPKLRKIGSMLSWRTRTFKRPQSNTFHRLRQGPLVDDLHELFRSDTADSDQAFTPPAASDPLGSKPARGRWALITQVPAYTYTPLRSRSAFRLLRAAKASAAPFQKAVHTELVEFPLGEAAPPYEALSYRWSSSVGTQIIKCNDKQFLITDTARGRWNICAGGTAGSGLTRSASTRKM